MGMPRQNHDSLRHRKYRDPCTHPRFLATAATRRAVRLRTAPRGNLNLFGPGGAIASALGRVVVVVVVSSALATSVTGVSLHYYVEKAHEIVTVTGTVLITTAGEMVYGKDTGIADVDTSIAKVPKCPSYLSLLWHYLFSSFWTRR